MPEKNTTQPPGGQDDVLSRLYRAAFNDMRCGSNCRARWLGDFAFTGRRVVEGRLSDCWVAEGMPSNGATFPVLNEDTARQMSCWCAAHQEVAALWLAGEAAR